jgi:hypothetical protein
MSSMNATSRTVVKSKATRRQQHSNRYKCTQAAAISLVAGLPHRISTCGFNTRDNDNFPACLQSSRRQKRLPTGIKKLRAWSAAMLAINKLPATHPAAVRRHSSVILKWPTLTQNYGTAAFLSGRRRPSHRPVTDWTRVTRCSSPPSYDGFADELASK